MAKVLPAHTTRLKPVRRNTSPGLVAPEYRHLWKLNSDDHFAWMFEGSSAIDVRSQSFATATANPTLGVTAVGTGSKFNGSTQYFTASQMNGLSTIPATGGECSILTVFRMDSTSDGAIFGTVDIGTNYNWNLQVNGDLFGAAPNEIIHYARFHDAAGKSQYAYTTTGPLVVGKTHVLGVTWNVDDQRMRLFLDGTELVATTHFDTSTAGASFDYPPLLGARNLRGTPDLHFDGVLNLVQVWTEEFPADEMLRLTADPFGMFRPARHVLDVTAGGITGTLAVTETADTLAASGTVTAPTFTGTLAVTEQADSLAASGTFTPNYTGTLAVTENADGLVASGTFIPGPISGTLILTEQADTLAASGSTATSTGRRQDGGLVASRQGGTMTVNRQEGGPV